MPLALTGYELGLLIVALVFIAFALVVALIIPRGRPGFPGNRLGVFIAVCFVLFAAQLTAVFLLAEVGEADEPVAHEGTTEPGSTEPAPAEPAPPTEPAPAVPPPAETGTTGETETTGEEETTDEGETETTEGQGDAAAGKEVFAANCVSCHTLADAGSTGNVGPNLDEASPSFDKVVERVTNGQGVMPSFKGALSEEQINDVAAYVSSVAG